MKKKKNSLFLLILFLVAIIITLLLFKLELLGNNNSNGGKTTTTKVDNGIKEYHASLIAGGDAIAHETLYKAAYNNGSYDFSGMLTNIKEYINGFDIKYYNQETVSDSTRSVSGYPSFNSPVEFNKNLMAAGFNTISLASNHSYDMGEASARKSAEWWEKQENVLVTGMATSADKRNDFKVMNANGITYTLLSYTYGTNGSKASDANLINYFNENDVKKDIEAVRDKVDVLIVAMHWGKEYSLDITDTQKNQAKFLADNGVDIVLGNHSHSVEPFDIIGNTYVFYSFGNLISNQMGSDVKKEQQMGTTGLLGMLDITKTVDTNKNETTIKIDNPRAELIYTYRYSDSATNNGYNYTVVPYSKITTNAMNDLIKINEVNDIKTVYNKYVDVLHKYNSSITVLPYRGMN